MQPNSSAWSWAYARWRCFSPIQQAVTLMSCLQCSVSPSAASNLSLWLDSPQDSTTIWTIWLKAGSKQRTNLTQQGAWCHISNSLRWWWPRVTAGSIKRGRWDSSFCVDCSCSMRMPTLICAPWLRKSSIGFSSNLSYSLHWWFWTPIRFSLTEIKFFYILQFFHGSQ